MAASTVAYSDTTGNKDYLGMIAGQIGRRLKEASDMASNERAYAEGQAEAGGTSLSEAGIGKGYFFRRALGSRFGGDAIARTKGRMGMGGAGTDPTGNFRSRFRGGFDYNVTNEIQAANAPLSGAVVSGLRGVESGLIAVSQSITRMDETLGGLAKTQFDMAKAIMFNGYLFQMFMSQQNRDKDRKSARAEERSLEGGRFGGSIGGSSFGGAGGGRGMINVTGGGSGGGGSDRDSKFFLGGPGVSFGTSNIGNIASRSLSTSLSAGQNMTSVASGGLKGAKSYKAISSGDIVGMVGSNNLYKKYGIDTAEILAKNPSNIAQTAAKMFGFSGAQADNVVDLVEGGVKSPMYLDDATKAAKQFGDLYTTSDSYVKRMLEQSVLSKQFGKEPDAIAKAMQNALGNVREMNTVRGALQKGSARALLDMADYNEVYEMVIKKYGQKNADQFMKLGLFGIDDLGQATYDSIGNSVLRNDAIADSLIKNYPDMTFESLEKAVLLARVGNMKDAGYGSTKIVKELRKTMGNNVADDLLLKYGDDVLTNTGVMKTFGKGSAKVGFRRLLKAIPGIGLGLGIIFGIQRAMKGDFLGAGLEISSGILGLNPATTGLGLGIDGFLLARDLGVTGMNDGGFVGPSGGPNKDTVPTLLTRGEFVMNRAATNRVGVDTLNAINDNQYFAKSFSNPSNTNEMANMLNNTSANASLGQMMMSTTIVNNNYAVAQGGSGGESSDSKFPTGFAAYNAQYSLASK